ncbi:MAG: glycosyltransferase family 39 protein [Candidatus Omnitrophica bacterium]|nr:glycosyltransferase family 39 protein [Candidatus Omnitrophota bacterium]MDE2231148.1 glycosyltransferase family 39 protein [Candidatus Omnitrophota bacterium]
MLKKTALVVIVLTIVLFNALRFWKLDSIPYGYHINELGSAVTLQCLVQEGCDARLKPWPLFGYMSYGQEKPPTYIYPGIIWARIFGVTVPSLRAYSAFVLCLGILGLFFLAQMMFGRYCALAVVLAASCSPWAWVVNRVALESFFAPVFAIWGLYFFWRSIRWWDWALAGFFWACAMYAYPPARLQIPLMLATLAAYEWGRRPARRTSALGLAAFFILPLLPMVVMYAHGQLSRRFDEISIFNKDFLYVIGNSESPYGPIGIFFNNFLLHLSPDFLFFTGDPSYIYSTRHLGLLSWLDDGALIILMVFLVLAVLHRSWDRNPVIKHRRWILFLAANFLIGIIPSALTNQGLPNALRMCGSWPFMMLLTGWMWWSAAQCCKLWWPAMALGGILSAAILAYQYFWIYPGESKTTFGYRAMEIAEQVETPQDWREFILNFRRQQYHCRYFLSQRLGLTCRQARDACLDANQ